MTKNNKKTFIARLAHNINFLENVADSSSADPVWQENTIVLPRHTPLVTVNILMGNEFSNLITEEYYLFKIRYMDGFNQGFYESLFVIQVILD